MLRFRVVIHVGPWNQRRRIGRVYGYLDRTSSDMEPRRTRTEEALHAQAQKCQRLASESLDPFVREALTEMASYYEHQAERLKQQGATKPQLRI